MSINQQLEKLQIGSSHAVLGVCLTLIKQQDQRLWFDVSNATLEVTNLGELSVGDKVNFESAARLGDRIDGHLVSGHIDAIGTVSEITRLGDNHQLCVSFPPQLAPYIAPKGSICVDGVSLTVNEVSGHKFCVNIIPHTWEQTCYHSNYAPATKVNLEVDMLARYAVNFLRQEDVIQFLHKQGSK